MELSEEDKQRIEQIADEWLKTQNGFVYSKRDGYVAGYSDATIYEREQINQLKAENERCKTAYTYIVTQLVTLRERNEELETLLHKILKESMGGNVLMTDETYNELKATLNV